MDRTEVVRELAECNARLLDLASTFHDEFRDELARLRELFLKLNEIDKDEGAGRGFNAGRMAQSASTVIAAVGLFIDAVDDFSSAPVPGKEKRYEN